MTHSLLAAGLAIGIAVAAMPAKAASDFDQVAIKAVFGAVCTAEAAGSYKAMQKIGPKFCSCSADLVAPQLTIDEVLHRTARANQVVKTAFHQCLETTIKDAVNDGTLTNHDFD